MRRSLATVLEVKLWFSLHLAFVDVFSESRVAFFAAELWSRDIGANLTRREGRASRAMVQIHGPSEGRRQSPLVSSRNFCQCVSIYLKVSSLRRCRWVLKTASRSAVHRRHSAKSVSRISIVHWFLGAQILERYEHYETSFAEIGRMRGCRALCPK